MKKFTLNQTSLSPILNELRKTDFLKDKIRIVPQYIFDVIDSFTDEELQLDLFKDRELITKAIIEVYSYLKSESVKRKDVSIYNIIPVSKELWKSFLKPILGSRLTQYGYAKLLKLMANRNNPLITLNKYPNGKFSDKGKCFQYSIWQRHGYIDDMTQVLVIYENERTVEIGESIINRIPTKFKSTILDSKIDFIKSINDIFKNETERFQKSIKKTNDITALKRNYDERLNINITKLISFNEFRYVKKGEKTNRLYHSFLGLPKYLRKHISCNNEKLIYEVDLSSSQVVMTLLVFIEQNYDIEEDLICSIEDGEFYEVVKNILDYYTKGSTKTTDIYLKRKRRLTAEELVTKKDTKKTTIYNKNIHELYSNDKEYRTLIKELVFSQLLFDFKPNAAFPLLIKKSFPLFYDSLCKLNEEVDRLNKERKTDIKLATVLQNKEAEIFLKLKPKYSKSYYFIHDAVVFTDERDVKIVYEQIKKVIDKYGIKFNCHFTNMETNKKLEL